MKLNLRLLYLYLFSFVGLLVSMIGAIGILDLTLKTYIFRIDERTYYPEPRIEGEPAVSQEELEKRSQTEAANQRKRQFSNNLAMILVAGPLYLYHWKTIQKESGSKK